MKRNINNFNYSQVQSCIFYRPDTKLSIFVVYCMGKFNNFMKTNKIFLLASLINGVSKSYPQNRGCFIIYIIFLKLLTVLL